MMLSTARQSCSRGLASWAQALPAESSRQAVLRSIATSRPPHSPSAIGARSLTRAAHGKATYSAAAVAQLAEEERQDSLHGHYSHRPGAVNAAERTDHAPDPRPPDPPQHPYQPTLTRLELFRALHTSRPLDALHLLCQLNHEEFSDLPIAEVNGLMSKLRATAAQQPRALEEFGELHMEHALSIIRDYLQEYPLRGASPSEILPPDQRLRWGHLNAFLSTCLATGQIRLFRSTFRERAKMQDEIGETLILPDDIIVKLSGRRLWRLITSLFHPSKFSWRWYTPLLLEKYLLAHLAIGQLEDIPRLFAQHDALGLKPTADSYAHLTQAHLRLGDFEGAKESTRKAEEDGKYDLEAQQLALLRGYRALGETKDLEENVLADLDHVGRQPAAGLLNAIIRLRILARDLPGALNILQRFDFGEDAGNASGKIMPNPETRLLAFQVSLEKRDLRGLQIAWKGLVHSRTTVSERYLILLIRALAQTGQIEVAFAIVQRALQAQSLPDWPVPEHLKPGTKSLNMLLNCLPRKEGLEGLSKVLRLFTRNDVAMDSDTTTMILEFARNDASFTPAQLANLASTLTREIPHSKPKVAHLDLLVSHAIHAAGRGRAIPASRLRRSAGTDERSAEAFQIAMQSILQSLRARGVKSSASSLRNRLRFDAYASAQRKTIPGAKETWAGLLARGYKPNRRHLIAIMQGYADAGAMDECQAMLHLASELHWPASSEMYMTLVVGWGRARDFSKAATAYRGWRALNGGKPDLIAASAIVQAANRSGRYSTAAALVSSEMGHFKLDRVAGFIAAQAYQGTRQYKEALDVVENIGPGLSTGLRKLVRRIRGYTLRQGVAHVPMRCQALLHADDKARPRHVRRKSAKRTARKVVYMLRTRKSRRRTGIPRRWSHKTRARRRKTRTAIEPLPQIGPDTVAEEESLPEPIWVAQAQYVPAIPPA